MSISWFIARRYIQVHRQRGFLSFISSIAILGVMLGTAALIITLSVLDGFEHNIKEKVIGFTSDIVVRGYQNKPLANYEQVIHRVKKEIVEVQAISPFAAREGMIRSKDNVDGIFLKGIDVATTVLTSSYHLVKGEFISENSQRKPQIVIGSKLANRLDIDIGDKIVVFALPENLSQNLQPRAMQFEAIGIYESGMAEFDDIYAYTDLKSAQKLFQLGENISGYDVKVNDIEHIERIAEKLQDFLGYPHYAQTVFQLFRNLFSWIDLQKRMSPILLSLIIIVAVVNIIGTLLMVVLEKTEAIGVLKTLGASSSLIQEIFRFQGLVIAIVGIILGNIIAFLCCWLQMEFKILTLPSDIYYMNSVPILLKTENFVLVSIATFVLCLLTSILPSKAAARLDPVIALRFG